MARYKVTLGMRIGAVGGTESYIIPDSSPSSASNLLQGLINKRRQMLSGIVQFDGYRIGILDNLQKRRSTEYPPGTFYPIDKPAQDGTGGTQVTLASAGAINDTEWRPDQAKSSLLLRLTFDTDRNAPHYLFGPPDRVLEEEPFSYVPSRLPAFAAALAAFRSFLLINRFEIRARSRSGAFVPFDVATWVNAATTPANLGAVITTTGSPPFVQGQRIQVLNTRRKGTDKMSYNGTYRVDSVAAGPGTNQFTVFLRETAGGVASSIKSLGRIQGIGYEYYAIQDLAGIKATTHKRGRPFGQSRGSRQTRVSLDP